MNRLTRKKKPLRNFYKAYCSVQLLCVLCLMGSGAKWHAQAAPQQDANRSSQANLTLADQALVEVDGRLITLRDVRLTLLVASLQSEASELWASDAAVMAQYHKARDQHVQLHLIRSYLEQIRLKSDLGQPQKEQALKSFAQGRSLLSLRRYMEKTEFAWEEVLEVIYDQHIKANFIEKQLGFRIDPQAADHRSFYLAHQSDRYRGASYEDVEKQVVEDYRAEALEKIYLHWYQEQRRKTTISLLPTVEEEISKNLKSFLQNLPTSKQF